MYVLKRPLRKNTIILFYRQVWVVLDVSLTLPMFAGELHVLYFNYLTICIFCIFVYEHTMLRSSVSTRTLNSIEPFR